MGQPRFHFHHSLHASMGEDSLPSFIVQGNTPVRLLLSLKVENRSTFPVTYRFLKSQTGSLNPGTDPPTRGTWASHSGPFTVVPLGSLTHIVSDTDQRFAISVDKDDTDASRVVNLLLSGYANADVDALQGILSAGMTAGGVTVDQGDQENFVYAVDGFVPTFPA